MVLDVIGLDALKTVCKEKCIYLPDPPDQGIALPRSLKNLVEELAKNNHDNWAKLKMKEGYVYGPQVNDSPMVKNHHDLLPYGMLSESTKESNRSVIKSTLNFVLGLGFHVRHVGNNSTRRGGDMRFSFWKVAKFASFWKSQSPISKPRSTSPLIPPVLDLRKTQSESNGIGDGGGGGSGDGGRRGMGRSYSQPGAASNKVDQMREIASKYHPKPIDTSSVELDKRTGELKDLISENMHDTWAKNLMDKGWRYGKNRDKMERPNMLPFVFLNDDDKKYNRDMAMAVLETLEVLGWEVRQD